MTETTALVTLNSPFKIGKGTIGKTLPGREVRLSPEGEIQVRGDMLATSTWSGGKMVQRQGEWLSTGDLGERNEQGELHLPRPSRKDDVIVTGGGMNIHPADLGPQAARHPGLRCVVPETNAGTEPVAVVLLAGSESHLQQAVQDAQQGTRRLPADSPRPRLAGTGVPLHFHRQAIAPQSRRVGLPDHEQPLRRNHIDRPEQAKARCWT